MRKFLIVALLSVPSLQASAQSWQWIAPLLHARAESEAVMMQNGKILVAGGYDQNSVLTSCEIYDPDANTWQQTGDMITARYRFELKVLPSGKVAAFGGLTDRSVATTANCEAYDPSTGLWSPLPTMPDPRENFPTAYLEDSSIILVGGLNANNVTYLNTGAILDAKTLALRTIAPMTIGTYGQFGHYVPSIHTFVKGSGAYGGLNGNYLKSTENYDVVTNTWSLGDSLASPVCDGNQHSVQMPDGTIVLPGGRSGMNSITQQVQVFDPATRHWYVRGNLDQPHFHCTCFLIGEDSILTVGGVTDPAYAADIVSYTSWYKFSDSSSWAGPILLEPVQVYSSVRYKFASHLSCGNKEKIYIFGGETSAKIPLNRCEMLDFGLKAGRPFGSSYQHLAIRGGSRGQNVTMPLMEDIGDSTYLKSSWSNLTSLTATFSFDSSKVTLESIAPPAGWTLGSVTNTGNSVTYVMTNNASSPTRPLNMGNAVFTVKGTLPGMTLVLLNQLVLHIGQSDDQVCLSTSEDEMWGIEIVPPASVVPNLADKDGNCVRPNPFEDYISIDDPSNIVTSTEIVDILGRPMHAEVVRSGTEARAVTSALQPGTYVIVCHLRDGVQAFRVTKER